jgi:lysine biosynthesis protein LysW
MAFAECPDCGRRIDLGRRPWVGQPASCGRCEAELEVIDLHPPSLDWVDQDVDEDLEAIWQFALETK